MSRARRGQPFAQLLALAAASVSLASACASRPAAPSDEPRTPARIVAPEARRASIASSAATAATAESLLSLDALAARGPSEAPLMRELLRVERAAPRSPEVRADRDLCLRAAFAASEAVRVRFIDGASTARGDPTYAASGMVPPRGPICVKKGETVRLVFESASADVMTRAVIFAAP